jgi:RNA polymerase sigma factor (sigma-70 family)
MNIGSKAVSIPNTWAARTVSHALATGEDLDKLEGVKDGTLRSLYDAMANDYDDITELEVAIPDHAVEYEKNDYEAHVMSVAVTTLDLRELNVLRGLFFEDKTREELGDEMGVTGTTISRWERELLDKIKRKL